MALFKRNKKKIKNEIFEFESPEGEFSYSDFDEEGEENDEENSKETLNNSGGNHRKSQEKLNETDSVNDSKLGEMGNSKSSNASNDSDEADNENGLDEADESDEKKPVYRGSHAFANPNTSKTADGCDDTLVLDAIDSMDSDITEEFPSVEGSTEDSVEDQVVPIIPIDAPKKKKKRSKKAILAVLGSIFGAIVLLYLSFVVFFTSHFGINSKIGGVDVSLKSTAAVEALLKENAPSYSLTINERNDVKETINGSDISFGYESTGEVKELIEAQNSFCWPVRLAKMLLKKSFGDYRVEYTYDKEALSKQIKSLDCDTPSTFVAPKNAYAEFNGEKYEIVAENPGTTIETDLLPDAIEEKIKYGITSIDLDKENLYVAPDVLSDDEKLNEKVELYNKYVPFSLTYEVENGDKYVLDGEEVFEWLEFSDDGEVSVDESKVRLWVQKFAEKYDTVGTTRSFTSAGDGRTYSVSGGTYGWSLDQDKEVQSILDMIDTKESQTRSPYWSSEAASFEAPEWGNSYVDVNLSSQHVYVVLNGSVSLSCDVVTGAPTAERATPSGVYSILERMRNKTLKGDVTGKDSNGDPIYEYETPVSYWARVTWSGVGFHDADWQSAFGGTRYKDGYGSHGCINMSPSNAATLYNLVKVGMPVIIHY